VQGGYEGVVEDADGRSVVVRLETGSTLRVRFGERVEHAGRKAPLAPPSTLWGPAAAAEAALRAWRSGRATSDGVPAYVVVNDKHLRGIALARPATPADLVACDGIGPAKLERYGEEILEVIEPFTA
jgi:superfamily II DNA helicase RecQ